MGDGKVDLPDDLLSSKSADETWPPEDMASLEETVRKRFSFDDSRDQITSESSIPLSPQWLYTKPTESKAGLSAASMDVCTPNALPHGNSADPVQKEVWRLDGSQEKKDWRKIAPEIENNRHWREEERETGVLGRKDRRKEGERENEYCKSDRRPNNASIRETTEARLPSSDRWHDVSSRNSGHETRRDNNKWSSRWGPEYKEKGSRAEKRMDVEKEDAHTEKQPFVSSNRAASERETDSRDKWRPRHRLEAQSNGAAVYRAAPGFGLERGRVESSNIGFAPGRGKSNNLAIVSISRPSSSAGIIGAAPVDKNGSLHGNCVLSAASFLYPRGKLLDIYRKHKLLPNFDTIPEGLADVSPITQLSFIEPLAFVSPDAEEKSVLEDIRKGKIISSGVSNNRTGVADKTSTESKHGIPSSSRAQEVGESIAKVEKEKARHENVCSFDGYMKKLDERDTNPGEHENKSVATVGLMDSGGVIPAVSIRTDVSSIREPSSSPTFFEKKDGEIETSMPNGDGGVGNSEHPMFEDAESATFDIQTKLLENSYPLFDLPCLHDINSSDEQYVKSNGERTLLRSGISPEEWSLFYRDPQGEIQGPFLGADIISWFNQGFFGTDLPVRLSDVLEGAPFQELGEVMPHLKFKTQVVSGINTDNKLESSDTIKGNLEASTLAPDFTESAVMNDQQWELSEFVGSPGRHVQPRISEVEDPLEPHYGRLPSSDSGASARNLSAEGRSVHEFVMQDTEAGVLFTERSGSSIGIPLGKPAGSFQTPLSNTTTHHFLANELHESSFNHMAPDDGSLHPSGRLWSDLEGTHQMCQSSDVSSGIVNEGHFINPVVGRDAPLFSHKNSFSTLADNLVVGETWTDSYRRNSFASPHAFQDTMDIHHLMRIEQEPNRCDLSEQLLSQKLQKKQVREQNILASYPSMHMNESVLEQLSSSAIPRNMNPGHQEAFSSPMQDLQHSLRVQLQQQLQQQQQQHLHQMQLQQLQQQQQESQVQQLLEQFRHHQTHDAGFGQSRVEPFRRSDMMDQVLLREKLLHELQQQSYLPARRHNPTPEQLFQAKFGRSLHRESRNDLLEHLSHSKHRKIPTLEQQILQGFQQRQLSLASRQQPRMEEERHVGGVWPVDESSQFVRAASSPHHTQSTGFSQLDFFRKQQNPSYEQSNHLRQNLALHERLQRGPYETSSLPFDRSIPLQAGAPGMNINLLIAMARVQGLDMQEQSAGQLAPFSSGASLAQPPPFLSQIDASHLNTMENRWSESKGQMPNNWIESQIYQLHLQTERQKRDSGQNLTYEDPNSWASVVKNDGYSKRGSMDFLHKIQGLPSTQSLEMGNRAPKSSYERREHTLFSQSDSEHSFNLVTDKVGLDCPFPEGPHHLNIRRGMQDWMLNVGMEEQVSGIESGERLIYRSNSQALIEEQYFPGMNKRAQEAYANSDMFGEHSVDSIDLLEAKNWKERKCGAKSKLDNKILSEVQESMVEQSVVGATNCGELLVDAPSRHTSLDNAGRNLNLGLDNFEMGVDNAYGGEEMAKEKISTISSIGNDNSMMKRSHVESILSTQEALHGLASAPTAKGKNMVNLAFSDEGRQAPAVRENPATRVSETMVSDEKEMLFHQYSACNDEDVSETSLTGTLKSTTKPVLEDDATIGISESSVAAQGGRSSKRKGKKGRQFDPALLGFTVSSSRSMGEIQRPDDY